MYLFASQNDKTITYVSAYFELEETPYYNEQQPEEWSPECIHSLLQSGIQLCLYVHPKSKYGEVFKRWECEFDHFKVMSYCIHYQKSWIHKECSKLSSLKLPSQRNKEKDTYEYLVYNHCKIELLDDAISENPWNSDHFAWVDFNITTLFQKPETLHWLGILGQRKYASPLMAVPGCWEKYNETTLANVDKTIFWRFCGAFLVGDISSLQQWISIHYSQFPLFLRKYNTLTWEVNYWAWLEAEGGWTPQWYRGDHNDTLLYLSADYYTTPLSPYIRERVKYNYLELPPYHPGSASYLYYKGLHLLNTRYVNYWMYPNGYYLFHNPQNIIENKNVLSILDPKKMVPMHSMEMQSIYLDREGKHLEIPYLEKPPFSEGLEDIRLYSNGEKVRFICTNVNFSANGRNRMIVGTYNIEQRLFQDCLIVQPPKSDSWCEKNWIPLVDEKGEEWFIYKWYPMELGQINVEKKVLEIKRSYSISSGLFSKVRGSSTFVEWVDGDYLVGLVHFSEEHTPRHYYHMLVMLEKNTFRPVKYTNTFYFERLSIEFCVGMTIVGNQYVFWISQFDRDPITLYVDVGDIPFVFNV